MLLQATHNFWCAGFVAEDGKIVDAAPIIRRRILFLPTAAAIKILVAAGAVVHPVSE